MSLRKLHRYIMRSVYKFVAVNVLLVGVIVALGFKEKKVLQRLTTCWNPFNQTDVKACS